MRVRALKKFEGLLDLERTDLEQKAVYPKAGDEWETSEERANFLQENGVVEIVENKKKTTKKEVEYLSDLEVKEEKPKETKTKKTSKK